MDITTLPQDVIAIILVNLPDYSSLASAALSSKSVWRVFEMSRRGILRDIALNMHGAALPMALRLARAQIEWPLIQKLGVADLEQFPTEPAIEKDTAVSVREATQLMVNFTSSCEIENHFSQRKKDRSSDESKLNWDDKARFQRALYRCWFFLHVSRKTPGSSEDMDRCTSFWTGVFRALPDSELMQLREFWRFYCALFAGHIDASIRELPSGSEVQYAARIVRAYATACIPPLLLPVVRRSFAVLDWIALRNDVATFLEGAAEINIGGLLTNECGGRRWDKRRQSPIIDTPIGTADICARCYERPFVSGLRQLWNATNWSTLHACYSVRDIALLVPKPLVVDSRDHPFFERYLSEHGLGLDQMIREMFDLAGRMRDEADYQWNRKDWLCSICIEAFLQGFVPRWWMEQQGVFNVSS